MPSTAIVRVLARAEDARRAGDARGVREPGPPYRRPRRPGGHPAPFTGLVREIPLDIATDRGHRSLGSRARSLLRELCGSLRAGDRTRITRGGGSKQFALRRRNARRREARAVQPKFTGATKAVLVARHLEAA